MVGNTEDFEFKCDNCGCTSRGKFEIKTDVEKKEKWDKNHAERIELRDKQEIVLEEFNKIADEHNSHWYNYFSTWHVLPRPCEDYLDVVDFRKDKPINSTPYDSTVMGGWINFLYRKPAFDYIECPVCHCKNYMNRC